MATNTETLRQIIKVDGIDKANKDVNSLKGTIDNSNNSLVTMGLRFVSVGLAVKTLTDSYKAFVTQRNAVNGVDLAIQSLGSQADITTEQVTKIASELQAITNYGDEQTLGTIFRPLIQAGIDSQDVLKQMGMTILNVADGTGRGIDSISNQIIGLVSGASKEVTELARATGISQEALKQALEGAGSSAERASRLIGVLNNKFEGFAEKSADPLTQLQNTIGDVKEELGRAFYPLIESLADSAKGFLSNKDNVDSLITSVKVLGAVIPFYALNKLSTSISAISLGGSGLAKTLENIGDRVNAINTLDYTFTNVKDSIMLTKEQIKLSESSLASVNEKIESLGKTTGIVSGNIKLHNSYLKQQATHTKDLVKQKTKLEATELKLKDATKLYNNYVFSNLKAIGSLTLKLTSWIGIAYSAYSVVKLLGESFGFWGNNVKKTKDNLSNLNVETNSFASGLRDSLSKIKEMSNKTNMTAFEQEELNKMVDDFNKKYGTSLKLGDDAELNAKNINKLEEESVEIANKRLLNQYELELARQKEVRSYRKMSEQEAKLYDEEEARIQAKIDGIKLTMKLNEDAKRKELDISALSKYYEMVKFADSNYYNWRKQMNKKEADDYKATLIEKGFSKEDAEKERIKLYKQTNIKLLQEQRAWRLEMDKATSFSYDKPKVYDGNMFDFSDNKTKEMIDKQINDISSYYESVKFLDKNYYGWKKQQIEDEVELLRISDEQKKLLLEERINALKMETEAYQNHYAIVNAGINGAMGSMLEFAKVTAKSNNDIAKAWYSLANAVIAELKRMVTQMIVNFMWQKMLGFLSFGTSSASGALPIGTGGGLPMGGGFASVGMNPNTGIGTVGNPVNNNTIRGNDISMQDLLVGIVNAIENNSIKGKITTIDRVELARELDVVNKNRSVL